VAAHCLSIASPLKDLISNYSRDISGRGFKISKEKCSSLNSTSFYEQANKTDKQ